MAKGLHRDPETEKGVGDAPAAHAHALTAAGSRGLDQRQVWEAIAESFDRTRAKPWTHVVDFVQALPAGSRVLDLMAGNGRHTKALVDAGHHAVALDWSVTLTRAAQRQALAAGCVVGDAAHLPFVDAAFDACIYVAGLHGIPDAAARAASLRELHRVLRPGGAAQVTVWSRDAPRFAPLGLAPGDADVEVPWRADGLNETRTYHLYTVAGLRADLAAAGFKVASVGPVSLKWADADNLVAVVGA